MQHMVILTVFLGETEVGRSEGERSVVEEEIWQELCLETALACLDLAEDFSTVCGKEEVTGYLFSEL